VSDVVRVKLPDVPVMVTVNAPVLDLLLAASVKLLIWVPFAGAKKAFIPVGKPVAVKLTVPLNPF